VKIGADVRQVLRVKCKYRSTLGPARARISQHFGISTGQPANIKRLGIARRAAKSVSNAVMVGRLAKDHWKIMGQKT